MDEHTKAALARARAVLAEAPEVDHVHTGPDPCPRCGGMPPEETPLTSWHPHEQRPGLRLVRNEESE